MSSTERSDNVYTQFTNMVHGLGPRPFYATHTQYRETDHTTPNNDLALVSTFLTKATHDMLVHSGNEVYRNLTEKCRIAEAELKILRCVLITVSLLPII